MDRRAFLAVGATALLAGCDGNGDENPTESPPNDGTDTPDENGPSGGGNTITPGGEFEASVTFESCTEFTVEAESFTYVGVDIANSSDVDTFEGEFSGSESFETDGPINSVTVYSDAGRYEQPNPDASECRDQAAE